MRRKINLGWQWKSVYNNSLLGYVIWLDVFHRHHPSLLKNDNCMTEKDSLCFTNIQIIDSSSVKHPLCEPVHEISNNVVCATSKASDQSLCLSLEYSITVKLLTEHHLEFLSLKGGCTGLSESTLLKMSNCWKSHAAAHISVAGLTACLACQLCEFEYFKEQLQ